MRRELIEASELLRRNDSAALEQAIGLLQNTVYSFSMKMCGHREDAEDTMQDVLFRSLPHLGRFPDPNALAAWLYTVTRNRCRRMRRTHVQPIANALSLEELMPGEAELHELLEQASRTPENQAIAAEEHHLLHQAVLRLPPAFRIVLVLHDMEELETEQVAQILGLQPGNVRVRLHRARLTVRKEMARILNGDAPQKAPGKQSRKHAAALQRRALPMEQCREMFANLSEYLDGRIDTASCEDMQQHIEACPNCVAFLKDLRKAIDRCKSLDLQCDPEVARRMRTLFTREYLRMTGLLENGEPAVSRMRPATDV